MFLHEPRNFVPWLLYQQTTNLHRPGQTSCGHRLPLPKTQSQMKTFLSLVEKYRNSNRNFQSIKDGFHPLTLLKRVLKMKRKEMIERSTWTQWQETIGEYRRKSFCSFVCCFFLIIFLTMLCLKCSNALRQLFLKCRNRYSGNINLLNLSFCQLNTKNWD